MLKLLAQAGLLESQRGIKGGYALARAADTITMADPVEEDIYHMSEAERHRRGIAELPGSLFEAIQEAENSEFIKETLGEHIFTKFIENKKIEWDAYRMHVSDFEIQRYLPIL